MKLCNIFSKIFSDPDIIQDIPSPVTQEEEERNMKRKSDDVFSLQKQEKVYTNNHTRQRFTH